MSSGPHLRYFLAFFGLLYVFSHNMDTQNDESSVGVTFAYDFMTIPVGGARTESPQVQGILLLAHPRG